MTGEASFAAHVKEQDLNDVQLFGTRGGAAWGKGEIYTDRNGFMVDVTPGYLRETDVWQEKMGHFIQVCRGMRDNVSDGRDGLAVQKILNGIYAAAEAGREIAI